MRPYLIGCYLSREEREWAKQITQVAHTGDAGAPVAGGTRLGIMIPEGWQGASEGGHQEETDGATRSS